MIAEAWKMSGGTLDDEVARAQVRKAREARQAGLEAPSYHLVSKLWLQTIDSRRTETASVSPVWVH